jgi:hypothetical protein
MKSLETNYYRYDSMKRAPTKVDKLPSITNVNKQNSAE